MSGTTIIAYIVMALTVGYAFVYPSFSEISTLNEQKTKLEASLTMANEIENKKNQLLATLENLPAGERKNIETVLPDSLNLVKLVADIDAIGAKRGISIDKISSREGAGTPGEAIGAAESSPTYQSAIVGFTFTSDYQNFRSFMDELEKSMRILDIKSVKITPGLKGTYVYTLEFETYWLKNK